MDKINGNDGAFATCDSGTESMTTWGGQKGLTKREYFAALVMQNLTGSWLSDNVTGWDERAIANQAVTFADYLIDELNK